MADKKQRLVLSILDFLNDSMQDGTVKDEDKEGIEVAAQTIAEAFGVDPSDEQQRERLSVKPANLTTIFDVFLKTRDRVAPQASAPPPAPAPAKPEVTAEDKARAEKLKQTGNSLMSKKDYTAAISSYTEAIELDPTNAVYYSNRAAAYSSIADHQKAVEDAEKAIEVDSKFIKAYSRLGHAHYSLGDYTSASTAFRKGLELDPSNANLKAGLDQAEARISEVAEDQSSATERAAPGAGGVPDLASMASMLGGMGGGGGAGGMPDLSSMMNNPAIMQMAQNLMANGGMDRLMSNPGVANMMNRMQSGGGMPSMQELMSDPSLRDLANTFGAGAGAGAGAEQGSGSSA